MNRIIKFRVWDSDNKRWLIPYPSIDARAVERPTPSFMIAGNGHTVIYFGYGGMSYVNFESNKDIFIKHQFTGLKDTNGKEIYEGDIIKGFSDLIAVVFWSDEESSFQIKTHGGGAFMNQNYMDNFEIVGNIFENPELLK